MSTSGRSEQSQDLGAFGYFAAIILCCVIVGGLAYGLGRENERRYETPASYAKLAKADAQSACTGRAGAAAFECIYEKVEAAQEQARDEQDLIAQQKAANSALISAVVAFATLILTGVGVWYVKQTLEATLEAVEDTGQATRAMQEANSIARQAASIANSAEFKAAIKSRADAKIRMISEQRQMRAYVSVEPGGVNESKDGLVRIPYNIKNSGQTPAYDLSVCGDIIIVEGDPRNFNPSKQGRLGEAEAFTDITLSPNDNQWNYAYMGDNLLDGHLENIAGRKAAIVHYGFIQYRDAFDTMRFTHFAFYHWGDELSDKESKRCRFGNNAT